jgi:hypothetical protein
MSIRNRSLGLILNEGVMLVVLVISVIVLVSTLTGISLDSTVNRITAPLDRSMSGILGGEATYQTAYRPSPVAASSPTEAGAVSPGIVTFTWQANASTDGVDRYRITVQKYINLKVIGFWFPAGSKGVRCALGLGCTSTSATLPLGGAYRWKVSAHNGAGWGRSSGYHYFSVR